VRKELLSTSFASITFEDGFLTTLRNDYLRQTFAFPERLQMEIAGERFDLGAAQRSEIYEKLITIDDFITGNEQFPDTQQMQIIRHSWEIADTCFEREVLLTSIEHDDCAFYMRYRCSKSAIIRWSIPLIHSEFAYLKKHGTSSSIVSGVIRKGGEFLQRHCFQIGDTWPRQHVNCYFNYKDVSLYVDVDDKGTLSTTFDVDDEWGTSQAFIHYAFAAICSDTIFLIEARCWRGAVAAITYGATADSPMPLFTRCWKGKFTPLLWFDEAQGIAGYRLLLMSLPKVQTIFVFGRVSFDDYVLLKHIVTQREGLGSEHAPSELSSRRTAKILLVYEDSDLTYTKSFVARFNEALAEWVKDAQSSAFPAYVPVTEPIVLNGNRSLLTQYQQIIWNRFTAAPAPVQVSFAVPEESLVAGIVAPLARYLHATIEMRSDPQFDRESRSSRGSGARPAVRYIVRKAGEPVTAGAILAGSNSTYLIEYADAADLASRIAIIFQNAKLLDLYLTYKSGDGHPEMQQVFEEAFPENASGALIEIGGRAKRNDNVDEITIASARSLLGSDFYSRLLVRLDSEDRLCLTDILSPANFPLLTPHVVLTGLAKDGAIHNLYSAANLSAARLLPLLLVEAPGSGKEWTEITGELNRSMFPESTDGISSRSLQHPLTNSLDSMRNVIGALSRDLARLFPMATIAGMNALNPVFLTFVPGDTSIPYELTQFAPGTGLNLQMSRFIGVNSSHGSAGLSFRTGRLAGRTRELTSRMICQSVLIYSSYREWPIRLGSFGDTLNDLEEASTEISDIVQFVRSLMTQLNQDSEAFELKGRRCTTARFIDVCNRGLDIIHFAGHAQASSVDFSTSFLTMADGGLGPLEIQGELKLRRNPIVIMNACESARPPGLIPDAFIEAGAGAIVGTLWPVFDTEASLFARYFVGNVIAGFSIGASLQTAKAKLAGGVYDEKQSARSWNSYILYGDPTWIPMIENFRNPKDSLLISERLINQELSSASNGG
jgi:hypothetical protein